MRCAEDARGYAAEFARRSPCTHPDRARLLASDVAENAPERAQASPACLEGDLGDGQVTVAQQRRGPLDAPCEQVPVRRDAEGLFE